MSTSAPGSIVNMVDSTGWLLRLSRVNQISDLRATIDVSVFKAVSNDRQRLAMLNLSLYDRPRNYAYQPLSLSPLALRIMCPGLVNLPVRARQQTSEILDKGYMTHSKLA